jgi:DNA processing protein
MDNEKLKYQVALTLIPGIGDVLGRKLVTLYGSVEAVFQETGKHARKIPRIVELLHHALKKKDVLNRANQELAFMERYKIEPLFFQDELYPLRLKMCHDSPLLLYFKGDVNLNGEHVVGIVGTRSATDYGRKMTQELIMGLVDQQVIVVSGLAYGIDSVAHRTSLDAGLPTVGVLGHGLDTVYPWQNRGMAERMVAQGGLLTEFISGTKPDRMNFPMRNRVIAGLCDLIIVVEAGKKGGALITADIANSYNRDVVAVPGRIGDPFSEGTNLLIRTNRASLIQKPEDIEYLMGWKSAIGQKRSVQQKLFYNLNEEETRIFELLKSMNQAGIDEICVVTGLTMNRVSASLLNLEFEGLVTCKPGKIYSLT